MRGGEAGTRREPIRGAREGETREEGDPDPEGKSDECAVEQSRKRRGAPPASGQEQGCREGAGEEPSGIVAQGHAVVGAAFWPHPEAQRSGSGIEDAVDQGEEQGGAEYPERAALEFGAPRGGDGPYHERRVRDRQQVRDETEDPAPQRVAVVEGSVRKPRDDPDRLNDVGEGREREQRERGPARPEVSRESDEGRQGYEEGGDVGACLAPGASGKRVAKYAAAKNRSEATIRGRGVARRTCVSTRVWYRSGRRAAGIFGPWSRVSST